jgi:demethylmenaquinone methyltransferase/2-methoxy-6-polyprenyl-1,4-benzoquinol methylase
VFEQRNAAEKDHATHVRDMFAAIAKRYDLLNHLLSGNVDRSWRRLVAQRVAERLAGSSTRILDVACGTGDLALTLFEFTEAQITATDFCRPMLEIAVRKSQPNTRRVKFVEGDALALPFLDRSFDAVTIGFGLRNFAAPEVGLTELLRVLRPGGLLAVLEFSKPQVLGMRQLFQLYFTKVLPLLGGIISGSRSAYSYLPDSVKTFPDQKQLASMIRKVGFDQVSYQNLTGGIAALHLARRPVSSG